MNNFNYTHIHLFDKSGSELPLVFDPAMIIQIPNTYNDDAIFYPISDVENNICDFYKKSSGGRYVKSDFLSFSETNSEAVVGCYIIIEGKKAKGKVKVKVTRVHSNLSEETGESEYIISEIIDKPSDFLNDYLDIVGFPFVTFKSSLAIDSVSVDLVETQSLYILIDEENEFKKISESSNLEINQIGGWADRFKLLFFIDNRQQNNFRFFKVESDQAIWTDRIICDFNNTEDPTRYRVDIGFTGSEEGVYEQQLIVCLLDSSCNENEKPGIIYPIGSITLTAEAIGEDERYRTLFANFGIPDPINYYNTFEDVDLNESRIDYKLLNEHSKYVFLTYKDTFPKAGSYGALAKAITTLGYEDLIFKEWYKEQGKDAGSDYITYDVDPNQPGGTTRDNIIENQPIEERINLKKLNWLSLIYKLNDFLDETVEDKYGFFKTRNIHKNYNSDIIAKLIYLKKWLEKYIIGLHCKIVDVGGEGVYLERYRLSSFGTYQQVFEWNNSKNLVPTIHNNFDAIELKDSSAYIYVNVGKNDNNIPLEEIKNYRIGDFCEGYFDESRIYHNMHRGLREGNNIIYVGSTFSKFNSFEKYELTAESKCKSFIFNYEFLTDDSARLRISDDELQFNPIDLLTKKKQSVFKRLPIIQLEKANIRKMNSTWKTSTLYKIYPDYENDTLSSYFIKNARTGQKENTVDYVTLVPPEFREDDEYTYIKPFGKSEYKKKKIYTPKVTSDNSLGEPYKLYEREAETRGLRYTAMNAYEIPLLCMIGYVCPEFKDFIRADEEYCIEILDGKLIFDDSDNNRTIYLNFHYDTDSKHQSIELNLVYYSEEYSAISYYNPNENNIIDGELYPTRLRKFFVGKNYEDVIDLYLNDPSEVNFYDYCYPIKVYNSGEFTVNVYARDIHNNLFGAACKEKAYVGTPDVIVTKYTNNKIDSNQDTHCDENDILKILNNYTNFCIFKPDYLIHDITKTLIRDNDKTLVKFTYPSYSYSSHNVNEGDFLHFMNLSDRYLINAIDSKTYLVENDEDFAEYNMILQKYSPSPKQRVLENNDYQALSLLNNNRVLMCEHDSSNKLILPTTSTNFIKEIRENEYYNFTDINFILYNELANSVIVQTPGNMINDKAVPYVDSSTTEYSSLNYINAYRDQYRLFLGDDSYKSYIWAILENTAEESIPKYLSNYSVESIDVPEDLPYTNVIESDETSEESQEDSEEVEENVSNDEEITYTNESNVLYSVSKFFIDLINEFRDESKNKLLLPTTDASGNIDSSLDWNIEDKLSNLFTSLNSIKDIDILDSSIKESCIKNGIDLYLDGASRSDSSIWFNPYFEIKSNLVKLNYNTFKSVATNQIYNIFARKTENPDIDDETAFAEDLIYKMINVDAAKLFEATSYAEGFLNRYVADYISIEDAEDPENVITIYSNILLEDIVKSMQVFSIDKYLLTDAIKGTIDALNTSFAKDSSGNSTNQYDKHKILNNIFVNIYNNFMRSEPDVFTVVNSTTLGTDTNYFYYDASGNVVDYSGNLYDSSGNIATDNGENILDSSGNIVKVVYDSSIENERKEIIVNRKTYSIYDAVLKSANNSNDHINLGNLSDGLYTVPERGDTEIPYNVAAYGGSGDSIPTAGKLQEIVADIYAKYIKGNDQLLSDPDKYIQYYASIVYVVYCYLGLVVADYIYNNGVRKLTPNSDNPTENIITNDILFKSDDLDNIFIKYASSEILFLQNETHILTKAFIDGLFKFIFGEYNTIETTEEDPNNPDEEIVIIETEIIDTIISGLLKEKSHSGVTGYESLYNKLLFNLIHYDINYLKDINWVTTTGYSNDYGGKVTLYAVAANDPLEETLDTAYYVKKPGYEREGYIYVNRADSIGSSIGNLEEIVDNPYITYYIQPTWRAQVIIIILSNRTAKSMGYEVDESADPDDYSEYMAIEYYNKKFIHAFNTGEIVKLIFESAENSEYIGQSSYEVVGYDIANKFVIIKGAINPAYIRKTGYEIWAKVKDCEYINEPSADDEESSIESYSTLETKLNEEFKSYKNDIDAVFKKSLKNDSSTLITSFSSISSKEIFKTFTSTQNVTEYNEEENTYETVEKLVTVPYSLSVKYCWDEEDIENYLASDINDESEETNRRLGSWYYQVMIYQNGIMYPVESSYTIADELVNVYISYAHNAYADYIIKAKDFVEKSDGYSEVYVDYTGVDMRKCDFIDDTFALSIRDYDTNVGMRAWMNRTPISQKQYIPNILIATEVNEEGEEFDIPFTETGVVDFPLYKSYMYSLTESSNKKPKQVIFDSKSKNTNVVFEVDYELSKINEEDAITYWKIYKENLNGTRQKLFESYNTLLYLDINDPGTYSIEALICDKYGNTSSTYYNAAIKII